MSALYQHHAIVGEAEPPFGAFAPRGLQAAVLRIARVPPFYRGSLRRPMANLVRRLGTGGTVDVRARGVAYRLRQGTNLIEDGILVHPTYNGIEIDFLLAGTPAGGVFVDLGANIGLYTLPLAARAGPSGRAVAIDANPDIVRALEFNVAASGLSNVAIACVAAGESEGRAHLAIAKGDLAIVEVEEDPEGDIPVKPLAAILADAGVTRVDTLKADIEGFEDKALAPFFATAPEAMRPKRIVIEHLGRHVWKTDLFPLFASLGYREAGRTRGNTLFERA